MQVSAAMQCRKECENKCRINLQNHISGEAIYIESNEKT